MKNEMRNFTKTLILMILLSLFGTGCKVFEPSKKPEDLTLETPKNLTCSSYWFKYSEKELDDDIEGNFDVICDGDKLVFSSLNYLLSSTSLVNINERGKTYYSTIKQNTPIIPKDINGDNVADLVISSYTGEAYCCYEFTILSLGKNFRKFEFMGFAEDDFEIADINHDGKFEVIVEDYSLARQEGFWTGASTQKESKPIYTFHFGKISRSSHF